MAGLLAFTLPAAAANERTLSFHNMHTGEDLTVTYKRDGQYIPAAMNQINYILRDWRRNEVKVMDPRLIDLVWEVVQQTSDGEGVVQIVCGYRAPATNEMLRENSDGVAQNSQHMGGNALDFFISGVNLASLRATGLRMQIGGVGYYPTSGWPFVHLDTGSVRMWPRMTTAQLQAVFPEGKTLYIPDNGRALPGYAEAQAEFRERGNQVVALFGEPSDATASGGARFASLFGRDDEPAASLTPPPAAAAVAAVPPTPRPAPGSTTVPPAAVQLASLAPVDVPLPRPNPDLIAPMPGLTITAAATAAPAEDKAPDFMMAFAGTGGSEVDPLAMLTDLAVSTPVVAAPAMAREWHDPLAMLQPGGVSGNVVPLLGDATTRTVAFAQFQAPDISDAPEFLVDPERAYATGFRPTVGGLRSDRFVPPPAAPVMVDLTRPGMTVASR